MNRPTIDQLCKVMGVDPVKLRAEIKEEALLTAREELRRFGFATPPAGATPMFIEASRVLALADAARNLIAEANFGRSIAEPRRRGIAGVTNEMLHKLWKALVDFESGSTTKKDES